MEIYDEYLEKIDQIVDEAYETGNFSFYDYPEFSDIKLADQSCLLSKIIVLNDDNDYFSDNSDRILRSLASVILSENEDTKTIMIETLKQSALEYFESSINLDIENSVEKHKNRLKEHDDDIDTNNRQYQ